MSILRFMKRPFITLCVLIFCSFTLIKDKEKSFHVVVSVFLFANFINLVRLDYKRKRKIDRTLHDKERERLHTGYGYVGSSEWMMNSSIIGSPSYELRHLSTQRKI